MKLDNHFTVANFGHVPWGRTLMGTLVLSDPIQACNPLSPLKYDWYNDSIPIIVAKRGECSFVTKANNVQLAGGKMLLIIDDKYEDVNNSILVGDGQRISIYIF